MINEIQQQPKPILYVGYSKEGFESKLLALNAALVPQWEGRASNYAEPLIDVDGVYYLVILWEYEHAFTDSEKARAVTREEIVLPEIERP